MLRQIALLDAGAPVHAETRGFDEARAETVPLRRKEDAPDYRYMPDPNLPPLLLSAVRRAATARPAARGVKQVVLTVAHDERDHPLSPSLLWAVLPRSFCIPRMFI